MRKRKILLFVFVLVLSAMPVLSRGIRDVSYTWVSMNTNYDRDRSGAVNIGDRILFTITLTNNGFSTEIAKISVGAIYADIQAYNDGLAVHGDALANDDKFNVIWTVKEDTSVYSAAIIGTYWDSLGTRHERASSQTLTLDAERPIVNNINVSPNSFNPYIQNCEIAYSMSEQVYNVTVIIYSNLALTGEIKELPRAPDEAGDNFITWWDGKNESGNFVQNPPDRDYYLSIRCRDLSGNYNVSPAAGIKISTLRLEIVSLEATPSPVSPDGDFVNDWLTVNSRYLLYSWNGQTRSAITTNQMKNLDLRGGLNWPLLSTYDNGDMLYYWPYLKSGFIVYYANGVERYECGYDLDPDVDGDAYFLNIFLNELGTNASTDGNKGNDWDTLRPLYDNGLEGLGGNEVDYGGGAGQFHDGIYSGKHSFIIKLPGTWENGVYIIRSQAELAGLEREKIIIQDQTSTFETYHFRPCTKGGYVTSEPAQCTFVVDNNPVSPVDFTPPHVVAVSPEDQATVKYRLSSVSAFLEDNLNGSGLDLSRSDIYLTDSTGNRMPGHKINNGTDVVSWELDRPLSVNGTYYMYVTPVDKRGNEVAQPLVYSFKLDVLEDNYNLITVTGGGEVKDGAGLVYLRIPPYAVEQDTRITVFKPFSFPGSYKVYNGCQFLPSLLAFKRPVEMILHYNDTDKAAMSGDGVIEGSLRIYNWKEDSWKYTGGNMETDRMTVTVKGPRTISGFYGLLPESVGGLPEDIISDVQVDKPFKQGGYISFRVSGSVTDLKLMIYDMAGSFVREISRENGQMIAVNNAGYYAVNWDLNSNDERTVNNGIYLFRFMAKRSDSASSVVSKAIPVIK